MTFPYGLFMPPQLLQGGEEDSSAVPAPAAPIPEHGVRRQPGPSFLERMFPAPSAMQGLVTPEDTDAARRQAMLSFGAAMMQGGAPRVGGSNLGQNLGEGIAAGQNAFTSALQNAAQLSGYASKMQEERDARAMQKRVLEGRQRVLAKYPPKPNEDVKATAMRLQQMLPELIAINDTEMVGKIVELLKSQGDLLGNKMKPPIEVDAGNEIHLVDPDTRETIRTIPKGAAPRNQDAQAALEAQRLFGREQTLASGYQKQIQDRVDAATFVNDTLAGVPAAKAGDGAAQVELLYAFVKALDPASVVREGEVALAREATPLVEWAKANVDKVRNKAVVVPSAMVDRFARLLERRLQGYERYIDRQRSYYINRAQRGGISDPEAVFLSAREIIGNSNVAQPPNAAAPTAGPALPDVRSLRGGSARSRGPGGGF